MLDLGLAKWSPRLVHKMSPMPSRLLGCVFREPNDTLRIPERFLGFFGPEVLLGPQVVSFGFEKMM